MFSNRNYPIVLNEFAKVGILYDVAAASFKNTEGLCFRTPHSITNTVLAKIPPGKSTKGSVDYGVRLGQAKLSSIMLKHASQCPSLSIRDNTQYVYYEEHYSLVHVQMDSAAGVDTISAPFIVACDGANSAFVTVNIDYDFSMHGYPAANHVIHPEDWAVIVRANLKPADVEPYVAGKIEQLMMLTLSTGLIYAAVLARVIPLARLPENVNFANWQRLLDQYATVRWKDFVQRVQSERDDFFNMLNKSPGSANFIALMMMGPMAEDLSPSPLYSFP
ncbi:FAD nadp-binding domain-containing [Fusarium sporotrichioides]|uniref:FAD nadp-binding domain-containing n=1 Tax=Fusarium sporotrichioides TaxID=5514 RepID=A0A395RVD2_FUSSP|nr:FAD nadp-binding domain-containing [Fusarium sporotrichioides]